MTAGTVLTLLVEVSLEKGKFIFKPGTKFILKIIRDNMLLVTDSKGNDHWLNINKVQVNETNKNPG